MKKTVIFDFDGVILDSFPNQYKWFQHISQRLGRTFMHSLEEFKSDYVEPVYPNMYELLGLDWKKNKSFIWGEYTEYMRNAKVGLVPGIADVLEDVRGLSLEMAIASSNTSDIILKHLDSNRLGHYFRAVITKEDLAEPG
ncbi:MAG: HAD hydrolase-like protein, partial [Nanoarchaeota archaeon]